MRSRGTSTHGEPSHRSQAEALLRPITRDLTPWRNDSPGMLFFQPPGHARGERQGPVCAEWLFLEVAGRLTRRAA